MHLYQTARITTDAQNNDSIPSPMPLPLSVQQATTDHDDHRTGKGSYHGTMRSTKEQVTKRPRPECKDRRIFRECKEDIVRNLESRICDLERNETQSLRRVSAKSDLALQEVRQLKQKLAAVVGPEFDAIQGMERKARIPANSVRTSAQTNQDEVLS